MSFLKKLGFAVLLVLLLSIAANAGAEYPVDPTFSQMRAFKQEELRYKARSEKDGAKGYSDGVSISISGTKSPAQTLTFTAKVDGVSDVSGYEFHWGISDSDRDPYGYLFYPQHGDLLGKKTIRYKFYSAGNYECFLSVSKDGSYVGYAYVSFTIAEDGTHPTIEQKAAQIVKTCKGSSNWETALNLYDWLTHHSYYDASLDYHGADILFYGYGVCDSYSKAYSLLCETAGIPVERCLGPNHAWNTLQLGGKWYQADATWDDPNSAQPGEGEAVSGYEGHLFFCVNAAAMKEISSHAYSDGSQEGEHAANCTSMDANYYIHEGLWKSFGDYYGRYADQILEQFANGYQVYEQSISTWVYYYDQDGNQQSEGFRYSSILREILKAGFPKYIFKYGNEEMKVRITVSDGPVLTAKLTGWDITETGTLTLPKKTTQILANAFEKTAATTVVIPQGCKTIGARAFANSGVRTVKIPASVTTIADDAFYSCGKIIMVTTNETAIEYAREHNMMVGVP